MCINFLFVRYDKGPNFKYHFFNFISIKITPILFSIIVLVNQFGNNETGINSE